METSPIEDPEPSAAAGAVLLPRSERRPSPLGRVLEWFWRGAALARAQAQAAGSRSRVDELERRARLAAEVAAHAFEPREHFAAGDAGFLACELYREAAHWALSALRETAAPMTTRPHAAARAASADREALWDSTDPHFLLQVAGDAAALAKLRAAFVDGSFADFAELPSDDQARSAVQLRALVTRLLGLLDAPKRTLDVLWLERLTRCGLALVFSAIAVVAGVRILDRLEPDLARGAPWRSSSDYGQGGCRSPAQDCDEGPFYFFHTRQEDKPWVEFDLGSPRAFTKVRVTNREDCCLERAVPLAVETSSDQRTWKRIAQRNELFSTWTAEFAPTRARWLRLRSMGRGPLHLKEVRVLP